ncbi:MAG: toll/interleukin-1 receptor domain-containing protein, partial [Xenococcaceae cyanobacterium]
MNTVSGFFDVFISYGRADSKPFATKLNERLIAQGLNVWFDQDDIEDSVKWQKEIDKGIENTHNFIFIVAP